MRSTILGAVAIALLTPAIVCAQATPKFSTATSTINDIMANAEAKAVLEKHIPQIAQYASMVGGQTLKQLQGMASGMLTDEMLAKLDADLSRIK